MEKSVYISSRLLVCFCTCLLVDKIVFGFLAFGDTCFSFCIKSLQVFRIILTSLGECSSSSYILKSKISIFLAFSGSLAMKSDHFYIFCRCFGCKFWICRSGSFLQNKNTRFWPFPWKRSTLQNHDRERTNQSARIFPRLALPYNIFYSPKQEGISFW